MSQYFVVYPSGDGEVYVHAMTKTEMEEALDGEYWGSSKDFLDRVPTNDPNYWPEHSFLIIKGEIVQPQAVQQITRHILP